MEPTAALQVLAAWLSAPSEVRPPHGLADALQTVAEHDLAEETGTFSATQEFWPDGWPARGVTERQQAEFDRRREHLRDELLRFIGTERKNTPSHLAEEVRASLVHAALECRQRAKSLEAERLVPQVRRTCLCLLGCGMFGAYLRPPLTAERLGDQSWGRLLHFVAARWLADRAIRFARFEHPARERDIEKRLLEAGLDVHQSTRDGLRRDDLPGEFIAIVHAGANKFDHQGVAQTIGYFVFAAASAWIDRVRHAVLSAPSTAADPHVNEPPGRPPRQDQDIPGVWEECRERFASGDAVRLWFLRRLRGPFPGVFNPAECGWLAIRGIVEARESLASAVPTPSSDKGPDPQSILAAFDPVQALSREGGTLLAKARRAIEERNGSPPRDWTLELLAGYYFLALIQSDRAFRSYPHPPADAHDETPSQALRENAIWFCLVDFLRRGYHLPESIRLEGEERPWAEVVQLLAPIDDLIAAHRVVRVTRLPPCACWQRFHDLAASRKLTETAVRQFYNRHQRLHSAEPPL
jgi:hypothetical protein